MADNPGLSWINYLADSNATLTASSEATAGLGAANLTDELLATVWRSEDADPATLDFDLGANKTVGVVGLFGLNHAALTWRVTLSTTASGNTDAFDSGTVDADVKPGYRQTLICPETPVTARYGRITLTDASSPAVAFHQAGTLWVGDLWRPSQDFIVIDEPGWVDPSEISRSRGGQIYVDVRDKYRTLEMEFAAVARDEAWNTILEIDRIAGIGHNLLLIPTPGGDYQNYEAILGRIVASTPVPRWDRDWHRKRYVLEERL